MVAEILNSYALNLESLHRLVDGLDEAQMVAQPPGVVNHAAWTIGHLVYSAQAIGGELGLAPWLDDAWVARFKTGSTPTGNAADYPSRDRLLAALDDARQRIASVMQRLGDDGLQQPLPDVRYRAMLPTLAHAALHILASHTALHVGELTVWRRALEQDASTRATERG